MRPLAVLSALCLATGLLTACADREMSTSPAATEGRALFSSVNGLDHAGFKPFVSLGTGCQVDVLGTELVDGLLIVHLRNHNIEVSTEKLVAGPATVIVDATIDLASGELVALPGTVQHMPSEVSGTWESTINGAHIENGKLLRVFVSGVGTGELEGLGIQFQVVISAKASTTPPHLLCVDGGSYLVMGKIFRLD